MFRTSLRRTLVGLAAAAMATAALAGPAPAAVAAPSDSPKAAAVDSASIKAAARKEAARIKAAGGVTTLATYPSVWTLSKRETTYDGGCDATTSVSYYPANDQAVMRTTITDPYWFAACRANARLWINTNGGSFPSAVNYAMACAVTDASCASTQTWTGNYYGATPQLTAYVDSVNAALVSMGLPPTYSRAQAVTGISITHSKA
ncbi:hypothetical protein [Micromonospora chersina]|uniref:hypothetical protein n=1 Tax=Micromonospora chersina TaxID=47854 RepID=UPI00371FBBA7